MECEYCDKPTDGSYVDRNMNFCNSSCARKQAEWEMKKFGRLLEKDEDK